MADCRRLLLWGGRGRAEKPLLRALAGTTLCQNGVIDTGSLMSELTKTTIIPFLNDIFDGRGADEYLGEPVTIGEHMLQPRISRRLTGTVKRWLYGAAS